MRVVAEAAPLRRAPGSDAMLDVWGGRTSLGLDCSGLVQIAMSAAGFACPRDSDMQEALGEPVSVAADLSGLARGDRVHWKGHVGVMTDGKHLLHANGFH